MRLPVQFIRYLAAGGIAASLNVASRILYNLWTSYTVAIVLAHFTGMVTTFLLARKYVFPNSEHTTAAYRAAAPFLVVQGVALLESWAISIFLAEHVLPQLGIWHFRHEIAHASGVAAAVFTNYFGNKHWTFRLRPNAHDTSSQQITLRDCE